MVNRRNMLRAGAITGGLGAVTIAAATGRATAAGNPTPATSSGGPRVSPAGDGNPWRPLRPFHGAHQGGILGDPLPAATIVAFDLTVADRTGLQGLLRTLTTALRSLTERDTAGEGPRALRVSC